MKSVLNHCFINVMLCWFPCTRCIKLLQSPETVHLKTRRDSLNNCKQFYSTPPNSWPSSDDTSKFLATFPKNSPKKNQLVESAIPLKKNQPSQKIPQKNQLVESVENRFASTTSANFTNSLNVASTSAGLRATRFGVEDVEPLGRKLVEGLSCQKKTWTLASN